MTTAIALPFPVQLRLLLKFDTVSLYEQACAELFGDVDIKTAAQFIKGDIWDGIPERNTMTRLQMFEIAINRISKRIRGVEHDNGNHSSNGAVSDRAAGRSGHAGKA